MGFTTDKKQLKELMKWKMNQKTLQNKAWKVKRKDNTEEGIQTKNAIKGIIYLSWSPLENEIKHLMHV